MSSEINNQNVTINQMLAPIAVGAAANMSPSLPALPGALAYDQTAPTSLLLGNGSSWYTLQGTTGGGPNVTASGTGTTLSNVTLTATNQPSMTGCNFTFENITVGGVSMKSFNFDYGGRTTAVTGGTTYISATGTMPPAFLPSQGGGLTVSSCWSFNGSAYVELHMSLVGSNGQFQLVFPTAGTYNVYQAGTNYV